MNSGASVDLTLGFLVVTVLGALGALAYYRKGHFPWTGFILGNLGLIGWGIIAFSKSNPRSKTQDPNQPEPTPPPWLMFILFPLGIICGIIQFLAITFGGIALVAGLSIVPYVFWFLFAVAGLVVMYIAYFVSIRVDALLSFLLVVVPGLGLLVFVAFNYLPLPFLPIQGSAASASPTSIPAINTARPANTAKSNQVPDTVYATLRAEPTATHDSCLSWEKITISDKGARLCVTGYVKSVGSDQVAYYIKFSDSPSSFYFVSYGYTYPDIKAGSCVRGSGMIKTIGTAPVIVLDELNRADFLNCGR